MYNSRSGNYQRYFARSGCPLTIAIIAAYVLSFFILSSGGRALAILGFHAMPGDITSIWTWVTWPLLGADHPFNVLFASLWAFWVCGSLERSWGIRTFAVFFFGTAAITAAGVALGSLLLRQVGLLVGLWSGIAPPTIAWCVVNRRQSICLWALVTVPAWAIAGFTLVLMWYNVGAAFGEPVLGLFALLGCLAAYLYAMYGRYAFQGYAANPIFHRRPKLRVDSFDREPARGGLSPVRRFRAWQERRKLERLWKRSMGDDKDERDLGSR
jgi:hypothetical protein